eukprot:4034422-Prymnesium_polylepis.1
MCLGGARASTPGGATTADAAGAAIRAADQSGAVRGAAALVVPLEARGEALAAPAGGQLEGRAEAAAR